MGIDDVTVKEPIQEPIQPNSLSCYVRSQDMIYIIL